MPFTALRPSRLQPARWRLLIVLQAALLAACTSTPLPPWTPTGSVATVPPAGQAPVPSLPGVPGMPQSVVTPSASVAPAVPLPYSAAVAARFPAPSLVYSTPGLQAGRSSYTTQSEIQTWLREQSIAAMRTAGVQAAVLSIGQSQSGQPLQALVLTRAPATSAAALQAYGKPTVMLIGQQHGDEPAGSEALLVIARELSQGLLQPLLDNINVLIVPRANPDGAANNQRATAGGLDMNRDHLLLNTPEAQALARLARDYQPTVVVDAHEYTVVGRFLEKFGHIQKFDALLQYSSTANTPEFLTKAAEEWYRRPALAALKAQGLSSEWYYTTSNDTADRKVSMGGTQPDTGRNVFGLKNAVSLLVESRGIGIGRLDLQRRVHTQVTVISSALASTSQRAAELMQLRPYIDKEISALACTGQAVVEAAATPAQYDLVMLDPVTGADKTLTVDWDSSLALRTLKTRARPCGYWVAETAANAIERLRLHGVQVMRIAESGSVLSDSYTETARAVGERRDVRGAIADPNGIITVQVALLRGLLDVPRGSYYIPLNQPLSNLVIAALEPDTQSSFFANRLLPSLQSSVRVMSQPSVRMEGLP